MQSSHELPIQYTEMYTKIPASQLGYILQPKL
jgi:hypothetical protein